MNFKKIKITLSFIVLISSSCLFTQENKGFNPNYTYEHSNSIVQDKNFYLLTVMQQIPEIKKTILSNKNLVNFYKKKKEDVKTSALNCKKDIDCHINTFLFQDEEITLISKQLKKLISKKSAIKKLVSTHLRPSGYFQNYANLTDKDLLIKSWEDAANSINHLINVYGKGKRPMYFKIDSIQYDRNTEFYRRLIDINVNSIATDTQKMELFFEPSLQFALNLLDGNDRDEAASFEPMEKGENKAVYEYIQTIYWNIYPYSILLIPGFGPEEERVSLSPVAKFRLKLAAERYNSKLAPIIVVSGGRVHPFRTPYNEAIEMKNHLIKRYQIPENAILIEPHARHTTTNFRNTARLIYKYGIPANKKALISTTKYQSTYISNENFDERCFEELGYIPYKLLKRLNQNDIEFLPILKSMHRNSMEPLDP